MGTSFCEKVIEFLVKVLLCNLQLSGTNNYE